MGRPLDAVAAAVAVVLCLSWGFNQVAVKLALPEIPPLIQAAFRSTFGALIVVAWARARGVKLMEPDGTLVPGLIAGVLFGLEFLLIYRGLVWTSASRASLFLYTAPFVVAIGARWLLPATAVPYCDVPQYWNTARVKAAITARATAHRTKRGTGGRKAGTFLSRG